MNDYLSDEDKELFRQSMQTVKPLRNKKNREPIAKPSPRSVCIPTASSPKLRQANHPIAQTPTYYLSDYTNEVVHADSTLSYGSQHIPNKRMKQLKNGQIPLEARLDLHGLKPDNARESLCQFINNQTQLNHRCLLIIHGKGSHRGEPPVLKNLVNHWLQQIPQILAFHSALARDGGHGALYVLLKRQRDVIRA